MEPVRRLLETHGGRYAVLHGWQDLPALPPTDLDVVVAPEDLPGLLSACATSSDPLLVTAHRHGSGRRLNLWLPRADAVVGLDVCTDVRLPRWPTAPAIGADELLVNRVRHRGFWACGPRAEFAYLLVKRIGKGRLTPAQFARLAHLARVVGPAARPLAARHVGDRAAAACCAALWGGDLAAFRDLLRRLRRELFLRLATRELPGAPGRVAGEVRRLAARARVAAGPLVAVLGPDGAGKSTVLDEVAARLGAAAIGVRRYHLMYGVGRPGGTGAPVTDPHGEPPRGLAGSAAKLAHFFLDAHLGYALSGRWARVRGAAVLFDRYYDDLVADPRRYRYGGPEGAARLLVRLLPRPDLLVVLDAPLDVVRARKQEVDATALAQILARYRRLVLDAPEGLWVDAAQAPAEVAEQVRTAVYDVCRERLEAHFPPLRDLAARDAAAAARAAGIVAAPGRPTHLVLHGKEGRTDFLPLASVAAFDRAARTRWGAAGGVHALARSLGAAMRGAWAGGRGPILRGLALAPGGIVARARAAAGWPEGPFAAALGTRGPHRTPVVQLLSESGTVHGFVKVGWTPQTTVLVHRERETLAQLAACRLDRLRVPAVAAFVGDGETCALATHSLEIARRRPAGLRLVVDALCEVADRTASDADPGARAAFVHGDLARRVEVLRRDPAVPRDQRHAVARAWQAAAAVLENARWPCWPLRLGDVTPWNTWTDEAGRRLHLVDLEDARPGWLPGWDAFHWVRGAGVRPGGDGPAARELVRLLAHLGVPPTDVDALFLLHVLDLYLSWRRTWTLAGTPPGPAARRGFRILANLLQFLATQVESSLARTRSTARLHRHALP